MSDTVTKAGVEGGEGSVRQVCSGKSLARLILTPSQRIDTARAPGEAAEKRAAPSARDEAVLDEEALRDLVAEIVREELMGTLGERITRNVRKLVRREINRALTSRNFD
ncbi:MAG: hypothetical protein H5U15_04435 [Roseovarius sp.]|jgi:hypothetical protein|nr:hypothetical protein [Roseovarius sp.]